MAFCRACQRETASYGELLPSGMVTRCGHGDCHQPIDGSPLPRPRSDGADAIAPRVAASPFGELANARQPGMILPGQVPQPPASLAAPASPPSPAPPPATTTPAARPAPIAPASPPPGTTPLEQLLPELRARLVEVRRQLAAMTALQHEEASLDRMLAAVDTPAPESPR